MQPLVVDADKRSDRSAHGSASDASSLSFNPQSVQSRRTSDSSSRLKFQLSHSLPNLLSPAVTRLGAARAAYATQSGAGAGAGAGAAAAMQPRGSAPTARAEAQLQLQESQESPPLSAGRRSVTPSGRLPPVVWSLPSVNAELALSAPSRQGTADVRSWRVKNAWSALARDDGDVDETGVNAAADVPPAVELALKSLSVAHSAYGDAGTPRDLHIDDTVADILSASGDSVAPSPRAHLLVRKARKAAEVYQDFVGAEEAARKALRQLQDAESAARVNEASGRNLAAWHTTQRARAHNRAVDKVRLAADAAADSSVAIAYLQGQQELCPGEAAVGDVVLYRAKEKVAYDTEFATSEEKRLLKEEATSYALRDTLETVHRTMQKRRAEMERRVADATAARVRASGEVDAAVAALRDRNLPPADAVVEYVPPPRPPPRDRTGLRFHSTFFDKPQASKFLSKSRTLKTKAPQYGRRRLR